MHHKAEIDIFVINTSDKLNYKVTNPYALFFLFVLTITFSVILLLSFSKGLPDELCPIEPSKRKQCGSDDITKKQCLRRSCCWDDIVPGATKCFEQPEPGK